jgi:septal ring factor EnvC (AmiA/AmiB activator)
MWKPPTRAWAAGLAIAALVATPALPASAAPVSSPASLATVSVTAASPATLVRDDYPSWDEVNAAKQNETDAADQVAKITATLDSLENISAQRANEALQRGEEYLQAERDLEAATTSAQVLAAQAADATAKADQSKTQVGQLVAQLYRSGGDSTLNLILNQGESDSLLYQLGTMSKLTAQTGQIRDAAVAAQNTATALTEQAQTAAAERDRLATAANDRLADAEDAQAAAAADVANEKAHKDTLVAQLASLKNTSVEVEAAYRAGEAAKAEELARQRAAQAETDAPGSAWVPGSGEIMSPAEAQNYASSIMGSYGWGGDQFSCLIQLWNGESGWRANAYNDSSGAYGIPQSLPASKMASVGDDYVTNAATQIIWGMNYIAGRYDTPCGAWSAWLARSPHWY